MCLLFIVLLPHPAVIFFFFFFHRTIRRRRLSTVQPSMDTQRWFQCCCRSWRTLRWETVSRRRLWIWQRCTDGCRSLTLTLFYVFQPPVLQVWRVQIVPFPFEFTYITKKKIASSHVTWFVAKWQWSTTGDREYEWTVMIDSWTVLKDVVLSCSSQMVESVSSRLSFHPRLKKISSHRAPMRSPIPQVLKRVLYGCQRCVVFC